MYVQVKLLNGCPGLFTYKIDSHDQSNNLVGSIVKVPLGNRIELGVIQEVQNGISILPSYKIKNIISHELLPNDNLYIKFISKLASYYCLTEFDLIKRLRNFLQDDKKIKDTPINNYQEDVKKKITLTEDQQYVFQIVFNKVKSHSYFPLLLHGVTGSGKTEVYKKLIEQTLKLNKTTILLLPEVSLAAQFIDLLKIGLPELQHVIFGFHSSISVIEKRALWQNLIDNKALLIIGVHLPVLLPISNLGLIIVDEEHEVGFQEKRHPKINTKEAALIRAQIYNVPILLGSATPAISSLHQVEQKKWHSEQLTKRFAGKFPQVKLVNLKIKNNRENFWISKELKEEIEVCLAKNEQAILFLNRRGYSFFVQCKECGHIFNCNTCSVSLTLHDDKTLNKSALNGILKCHYCNFSQNFPNHCTSCNAPNNALLKKGLGTQQLVAIIKKIFPQAIIERADLDTTVNKKKWKEIINKFSNGEINILVGTQTITKGYDFSNVSLIGIIWADINLGLPIYTASEVTLQQLIQVSGRAGRKLQNSKVIVQTMLNSEIYEHIQEIDYKNFYENEIKKREITNYPPCIRLAEIELKNSSEQVINFESQKIANFLENLIFSKKIDVKLLGPSQPPVYKIKNYFIRKIYLKSKNLSNLIKLYKSLEKDKYTSSIFFTPNPLSI